MKFSQIPHIKVLDFFFKNSYTEIHLRELSRRLNISVYTLKHVVDELVDMNLIEEYRRANLRVFKANMKNLFFKYLKIAFNIKLILDSGLINYIRQTIPAVSSIILFGSMAKGEDTIKSDLDLLVIGYKRFLDLTPYEKRLQRRIQLIIYKWSEWRAKADENEAFYYEVILHGIPLYGEKPVVK
ncbi:MAG: nucleotidyltransferase domain-containing protein [archaeon GB-1867-035]|nr:nucleotidyltransferase domain-containing protein [Candidatus Culexmicrobium profundum]